MLKLSPCLIKGIRWSGDIAKHILHLRSRRWRIFSFIPWPIWPREAGFGSLWTRGQIGSRAGLQILEKREISDPCRESKPDSSFLHTLAYYYYYYNCGHCTCKHNIEAPLSRYYCLLKAVNITYAQCVSVALVMQHWKRLYFHLLWPVRLLHVFPHYLTNGTIFGWGGEKVLNTKRVPIFSTTFV